MNGQFVMKLNKHGSEFEKFRDADACRLESCNLQKLVKELLAIDQNYWDTIEVLELKETVVASISFRD